MTKHAKPEEVTERDIVEVMTHLDRALEHELLAVGFPYLEILIGKEWMITTQRHLPHPSQASAVVTGLYMLRATINGLLGHEEMRPRMAEIREMCAKVILEPLTDRQTMVLTTKCLKKQQEQASADALSVLGSVPTDKLPRA